MSFLSSEWDAHLREALITDNMVPRYLKREGKRRVKNLQWSTTSYSKRMVALVFSSVAGRILAFLQSDRSLWPKRLISTSSLIEGFAKPRGKILFLSSELSLPDAFFNKFQRIWLAIYVDTAGALVPKTTSAEEKISQPQC